MKTHKLSVNFLAFVLSSVNLSTVTLLSPAPARASVPCQPGTVRNYANGSLASCVLSQNSQVRITSSSSNSIFLCQGGHQIFFDEQGGFISCVMDKPTTITRGLETELCPPDLALRFQTSNNGQTFINCRRYNNGVTVELLRNPRPVIRVTDNFHTYNYQCKQDGNLFFNPQTEEASCILDQSFTYSSGNNWAYCEEDDRIRAGVLEDGNPYVRCERLTLPWLKPRGFLRHRCLNILLVQVPRLNTFAHPRVLMSPYVVSGV
jgi:hypothetical protein